MTYWLELWWLAPIALSICVLVCLVGVEGSLLFALLRGHLPLAVGR